jgi:hypothetical protein
MQTSVTDLFGIEHPIPPGSSGLVKPAPQWIVQASGPSPQIPS